VDIWLLYAFGYVGLVKTKRNRGVEGARISASFIIHVWEVSARHISTRNFRAHTQHEFHFDACTQGNCRLRLRFTLGIISFVHPAAKLHTPLSADNFWQYSLKGNIMESLTRRCTNLARAMFGVKINFCASYNLLCIFQ